MPNQLKIMQEKRDELRLEHRLVLKEYTAAKARIAEYQIRRHLPPGEEMECRLLQRIKLQRKDALVKLERDLRDADTAVAKLQCTATAKAID